MCHVGTFTELTAGVGVGEGPLFGVGVGDGEVTFTSPQPTASTAATVAIIMIMIVCRRADDKEEKDWEAVSNAENTPYFITDHPFVQTKVRGERANPSLRIAPLQMTNLEALCWKDAAALDRDAPA